MSPVHAKIVDGGRLVVPAAIRRAMKLEVGDTVVLELDGEELRIRTAKKALRDLQDMLRALVPAGVSLADELIADRRAESARE